MSFRISSRAWYLFAIFTLTAGGFTITFLDAFTGTVEGLE